MRVLRQNLGDRAGLPADDRRGSGRRCGGAWQRRRADGRFELYKISAVFEGDESRRQHGLPLMDELTA